MRTVVLIVPLVASAGAPAALISSTWVGGPAGTWNVAANWSPVGIPNNGANTYDVVVDGAATASGVLANVTATISDLTVGGNDSVTVGNGVVLGLIGGQVNNDGLIFVDGSSALTELRLYAATTLSGSGRLRLGDTNSLVRGWSSSYSLTNDAGHTIEGGGSLGADGTIINNYGLIDANSVSPMYVNNWDSTGNPNSGTFRASNGATLWIVNSEIVHSGAGRIEAQPRSTVVFQDAVISQGTLEDVDGVAGPGVLRVASGGPYSQFSSVKVLGELEVAGDVNLYLANSLVNDGMISLTGAGSPTNLLPGVLAGQSMFLSGTGELMLEDSTFSRITGVGTLRHQAPHLIRGTGVVGTDTLRLWNESVIQADSRNGIELDLVDDDPAFPDVYNNLNQLGGTLRAAGGATLTIKDTRILNAGNGAIEAAAGSFVDFVDATGVKSGVIRDIDGAGPGEVRNLGTCRLHDVKIEGPFDGMDGSTTIAKGMIALGTATIAGELDLSSAGTPNVNTDLLIESAATFGGGGTLVLSNQLSNRIRAAGSGVPIPALTNAAGNTIRGAGQLGVDTLTTLNAGSIIADTSKGITIDPPAAGSFTNQTTGLVRATLGDVRISPGGFATFGTVIVDPGRLIRRTGNFDQGNAASLTKVNGRLIVDGGGVFNLMAGTLSGTFRVEALTLFNMGGTLAPGDAPIAPGGTLDIKGNYVQSGPARLKVTIAGPPVPNSGNWGQVRVMPPGTATLGGTLEVVLTAGPPAPGAKYTILTAPLGFTGTFSNILGPSGMTVYYDPAGKFVQLKF